jgi:hypothetical protein
MRVDGLNGIVVVGGYGAVGRTVCAELAGRVFAAGRNLAKAEAFSREMGDRMLPLGLDLADPGGAAGVLGGARVVVASAGPGVPAPADQRGDPARPPQVRPEHSAQGGVAGVARGAPLL